MPRIVPSLQKMLINNSKRATRRGGTRYPERGSEAARQRGFMIKPQTPRLRPGFEPGFFTHHEPVAAGEYLTFRLIFSSVGTPMPKPHRCVVGIK